MKKFNELLSNIKDIEESIQIDEVLKASDPTSKWISDFVHSDNPKFEGKSKKQRINMALGAAYAAKRASKNEELDLSVIESIAEELDLEIIEQKSDLEYAEDARIEALKLKEDDNLDGFHMLMAVHHCHLSEHFAENQKYNLAEKHDLLAVEHLNELDESYSSELLEKLLTDGVASATANYGVPITIVPAGPAKNKTWSGTARATSARGTSYDASVDKEVRTSKTKTPATINPRRRKEVEQEINRKAIFGEEIETEDYDLDEDNHGGVKVGEKVRITNPNAAPKHTITRIAKGMATVQKGDGSTVVLPIERLKKIKSQAMMNEEETDLQEAKTINNPTVHDLRHLKSSSAVYDATQGGYRDKEGKDREVKDGDVIHTSKGVGILNQAWPVHHSGSEGAFHKLKPGYSMHTIDDGKYKKSVELANSVTKQNLKQTMKHGSGGMVGPKGKLPEEIEQHEGVAEAINPENPRDYNKPTYLRKKAGQAPLTTKDIKDRDTESPTTPEGLAKKAKKLGLDEISTAYINKQAPDYASRASNQSELLKKKVYSIFKDNAASAEEKQKYMSRRKGLASYQKKVSAEYEKTYPTQTRKKPDEDKLQSSFRTGRYDDTYGT